MVLCNCRAFFRPSVCASFRLTLVDLLWLIFRWSSNVLFDLNNTQKLLFASVLTILRLIKITILLKLELSYLACTQKFMLL